jgi:hypothetical protein
MELGPYRASVQEHDGLPFSDILYDETATCAKIEMMARMITCNEDSMGKLD